MAAGYDINFVLPTFWHPIFTAIDHEAYGVAATLLSLGTHLEHRDPRHGNATIERRLLEEQSKWTGLLAITRANGYQTGTGMSSRRLAGIEAAPDVLRTRRHNRSQDP